MRFFRSFLILFLLVSGTLICAAGKPAVLFTGSHGGWCGSQMANALVKAGFNVNSTGHPGLASPLTWSQAEKYNVIVLSGLGESNADGSLTAGNRQTLATLRNFLESGGGLLVLGHFGQRDTEISPQDDFLNPLGLKPLWQDIPVDSKNSIEATIWKVDFAYTTDIKTSPVTQGVKALWYPAPRDRIGAQHHSVTFKADNNWQTVVYGSPDSKTTTEYKGSMVNNTTGMRKSAVFNHSVPLVACHQAGKGRIVYLGISHEYLQGANADTILEDIVNAKGLDGKTSDGLKLFENSLRWLAAPSEHGSKLGGATTPQALLKDPVKVDFCGPFDWNKQIAFPFGRYNDLPGVIGPRTTYSSGNASPAEWVKAAKAKGYRFIAFLEDFKQLTPQKFNQLKADCKKLTDENFAAMAGFTIDDEVGNHYFYFGSTLPLPATELFDKDKKVFVSYDPGLDRKNPYLKGQLNSTTLFYFIGKCIGQLTGGNYLFNKDAAPFADYFGNWNAMGVVTTDNGKLEEFVFNDYLKLCNSGQSPTPIAINLMSSPKQLDQIKWRTVYKSQDGTVKDLLKFFNRQKFYPDTPSEIYLTSGPKINDWGYVGERDYVFMNKGDFVWQNYRWKVYGKTTSKTGLKEVKIWNGTKLFRRFDPHGAKKFSFTLDLNHDKQHYLVMEITDNNGGVAVSEGIWDRNHRNEEFMCADRNNQLSFSQTINKDGYYINAGGNQALSTPNKRLISGGLSPSGTFKCHPMLGAPGFDGAAGGEPEFFESGMIEGKDSMTHPAPDVAESKRVMHCGDVNIGEAAKEYRFKDGIQAANVWHTVWTTAPAEDFIYSVRNHYFQLDPDKPLAVFLKRIKITLKKDLPNNGILLGMLDPRKAKEYAIRASNGTVYAGCWNSDPNTGSLKVDLTHGYGGLLDSPLGSATIFPLSEGINGSINCTKSSRLNFMLNAEKSPQKAGETAEVELLLLGIPRPTPPLTDNLPLKPQETVEKFYRDFGLAADGKTGYTLDIQSGKLTSQKYMLKIDGSQDKCFAGKISGTLISALPVIVSGLNDNWSAYLYDSREQKARPLGVMESTAWASVVVNGQDIFAGQPVIADNEALHIQVTQAGANAWNVEIHNPTDKAITANIRLNKYFPPFKSKAQPGKVVIPAGTSVNKTF